MNKYSKPFIVMCNEQQNNQLITQNKELKFLGKLRKEKEKECQSLFIKYMELRKRISEVKNVPVIASLLEKQIAPTFSDWQLAKNELDKIKNEEQKEILILASYLVKVKKEQINNKIITDILMRTGVI